MASTHLLAGLGWVDLDLGCSTGHGPLHRPLGCTAAAVLPKQDSGTSQIQVNPNKVREEMGHPVQGEPAVTWVGLTSLTLI